MFETTIIVVRREHRMPAKVIVEVRPNVPFDLLVVNLTNILFHVQKHMVSSSSSDGMASISDQEQVRKERHNAVDTV